MTYTDKLDILITKLEQLEKKVDQLQERHVVMSLEEISLGRACKILRRGADTLIEEVKRGKLKAITYRDKNRKTRYRFRIADIREYQENIKRISRE